MDNVLNSASKIVLLIVVSTLCIALLWGVFTGKVDYKDLTVAFIALMSSVSGFYFANKGDPTKEFLGK